MSKFNRWWSTLNAHIVLPQGWRDAKTWASEAYHLRDEEIEQLKTELARYKQGVEVEGIVCSGEEEDGSSNGFRWIMLPDEFKVGQRVRVLVMKEGGDE